MQILLWIALAGLVLSYGGWKYLQKEQELQELKETSADLLRVNDQMKRTLAFGLYNRFKTDAEGGGEDVSGLYARNNPYEFQYFVAELFEELHGGTAFVATGSGEQGYDIEHRRQTGLYLISAQCSKQDVPFEAVAILHSQVVKHKAKAGILLSTGGFHDRAVQYALDTGIRLIDGAGLVDMWAECLAKKHESLRKLKSSQPASLKTAHL